MPLHSEEETKAKKLLVQLIRVILYLINNITIHAPIKGVEQTASLMVDLAEWGIISKNKSLVTSKRTVSVHVSIDA